MWRMLSYALTAFTLTEALAIAAYRGAYVWLNLTPDQWGVTAALPILGIASLIAGLSVGYHAAEEATRESISKHEREGKEIELRFKFQTEELARKTELEKLHIKADQDKVKRLEDLIGIPDPDGEVVSINSSKKVRE